MNDEQNVFAVYFVLVLVALVLWALFKILEGTSEEDEKSAPPRRNARPSLLNEKQRLLNEKLERERLNDLEWEREQQQLKKHRLEKARHKAPDPEGFEHDVSQTMPRSVLRNHKEFMKENPLSPWTKWYGEDVSPLTYYGYRVGKTRGLRPRERREIITYVMRVRLTAPLALTYQDGWGAPLSRRRRDAIVTHIDRLAAQRSSRRGYEVAVSDWEEDSFWAMGALDEEISRWGR